MPDPDTADALVLELANWCYWPLVGIEGRPMVYCPICENQAERGQPIEHEPTCLLARARALVAAGVRV